MFKRQVRQLTNFKCLIRLNAGEIYRARRRLFDVDNNKTQNINDKRS